MILSGGVGDVKSRSFLLPIWVAKILVCDGSFAACDSCVGLPFLALMVGFQPVTFSCEWG